MEKLGIDAGKSFSSLNVVLAFSPVEFSTILILQPWGKALLYLHCILATFVGRSISPPCLITLCLLYEANHGETGSMSLPQGLSQCRELNKKSNNVC
jgi:hypothetical protein